MVVGITIRDYHRDPFPHSLLGTRHSILPGRKSSALLQAQAGPRSRPGFQTSQTLVPTKASYIASCYRTYDTLPGPTKAYALPERAAPPCNDQEVLKSGPICVFVEFLGFAQSSQGIVKERVFTGCDGVFVRVPKYSFLKHIGLSANS